MESFAGSIWTKWLAYGSTTSHAAIARKGRGSHVAEAKSGNVKRGESAGETVRVSVAELELVRRLLFAAGNLAICVLESDAALVSDEVLGKARYLQALYGELAG